MRIVVFLVFLLAGIHSASGSADAKQLMDAVIAQLPPQPLSISGELIVRQRRGVVVDRYPFDFFLHWGGSPPLARYRIKAVDGTLLEEMEIRRLAEGDNLVYRQGDPPETASPPALDARIQATDFTWLDLFLDFMWWENPIFTGAESVRGFDCVIVTATAPEKHAGNYAAVRMWIEPVQHLLLQAEAVDKRGRPVHKLWVTSVQKIEEQWMIKEMESQRYPSTQRTRLRIEEVVETER